MTQDEIQAVARAICDDAGCIWDDDPNTPARLEWSRAAKAAIAALDAARGKAEPVPFAWATWHDPPMLFLSHGDAMLYCDDDEKPIPLYELDRGGAVQWLR